MNPLRSPTTEKREKALRKNTTKFPEERQSNFREKPRSFLQFVRFATLDSELDDGMVNTKRVRVPPKMRRKTTDVISKVS
uniref:Uncharacterized protein n=1 Tax=Vespula pensylvanica TaxID=30213 RepID=A0A834PAA8_VESPE|nr:hypothetical protein H0235_002474 [Vespula pensylvanica]